GRPDRLRLRGALPRRSLPGFRDLVLDQRRQIFKEYLLERKLTFDIEGEIQISSNRMMTSEDQVQERTEPLKLKTNMADKENIRRHTENINTTMEKNYIPLKASNELTNSPAIETHNLEADDQTLQLLPVNNDSQNQTMTLSQAFHLKKNHKKKQVIAEKPKQDASVLKKPVLGYYHGQIVQSKVNSFRKPLQVKDESSATKKLCASVSKGTKPNSVKTSNATKSYKASNMTATTTLENLTSQNTQLVRPPNRNHSNTQHKAKQDISRTSANVTVPKNPTEKEQLQSETVLGSVKSSSQGTKNKALQSKTDSKTVDHRRHTLAKATVDGSAQLKETSRAGKGRVLKRPPNPVSAQPEPEGPNANPVGSFWTTMAEEDEQRLFTDKVNKIFSECLKLIHEGYPKEEIMTTLNDVIKNIPDAKKLVKYWICLIRIESITSPVENIISIYEKPIEEMRQTVVDIITMKNQEKSNCGKNIEDACKTKEQIQEVNTEDTGVNLEPGKQEMENKHSRNVVFEGCEQQQDDTKNPSDNFKTPDAENRSGCLIKYNISTTPYLQSIKKKMQFDETNPALKELKFLTPVRRSRRLQEKTSKLPDMLKDHYPCVSSLEQLSELGGETDAFVCRPNVALCPMYSETDTSEEK
uniref:Cytoskeleton associated protein 2 n=1 Tax=Cavia porcellus TaxID=10141 RepID=H0VLB1_CAVPO